MSTIEQTLLRLQKSAFRAKFHLSEKDRQYIMDKGMGTIQHQAADFIRTRLAPAIIPNDGKQTPMRGHPVFIAQHACACCCRSCLNKWYHVPIGRELTEDEQNKKSTCGTVSYMPAVFGCYLAEYVIKRL